MKNPGVYDGKKLLKKVSSKRMRIAKFILRCKGWRQWIFWTPIDAIANDKMFEWVFRSLWSMIPAEAKGRVWAGIQQVDSSALENEEDPSKLG